jgi:D-alanyl-D-alanine endopeptidase (penicillin-binding protein 7)
MLVRSDNSAAETLAHDFPGGRAEFIQDMNDRARFIGMKNTHFDDASGLSANNVTTAHDLGLLLKEALKYDFVREISTTKATEITVPTKKHPHARVVITNTNSPLLSEFTAVVSKTGLTSQAGWCVAMVIDEGGQRYVIVVLGAPNKAARMKIVEKTVFASLRSN